MSLGKITAGVTIAGAIAYLVFAVIDTRYGVSAQIAAKLP